ncbi:uncharacterized protein [Palaemon carinicauda]|uniref:uncharacterized protein n=1 Tax=Palaemon carinicauda TaxID=392227 RepID=UPI0035B694F2
MATAFGNCSRPFSYTQAVTEVGCTRKDRLTPCLPPKPRCGRPRKIKPATLRLIHRQLKKDTSPIVREIKDKNIRVLGEVSLRTVQESIHDDFLLRSYKARKKPLLTVAQKQKRVAFVKKYSVWEPAKWREVLWTDEATFSVTGSSAKRVYRPSGSDPHLPQYTSKTVKHPASVMVWGSFGYNGVGSSPDLNPNENLWSVIKRKLQSKDTSSIPKLEAAIREFRGSSWSGALGQFSVEYFLWESRWIHPMHVSYPEEAVVDDGGLHADQRGSF